jgi:hypothetical protein
LDDPLEEFMLRVALYSVATIVLLNAPMSAQSAAPAGVPNTMGVPSAAAAMGTAYGVTRAAANAKDPVPAPQDASRRRRGKVLMIVGGAALVGGFVIGDNPGAALIIGGSLVFLWGLWNYLG